ncbi:MAG: hypothetical protein CL842_08800 [Crocinitomicaceae bacterium]|nr:hypothetical protein [Crocinitomicaceae bacterium]|tara:strand:- start:38180 stop:38782 length:603 start_codon:yes stop_codon:yes gene_type:complete
MPLLKHFKSNNQKQIIVWRMEEEFLEYQSIPEIREIKHSSRRKEKIAVLYLLANFFDEVELSYDDQGKPQLSNSNKFISISHSNAILAVGIGNNDFGLDIEKLTHKAVRISKKFIHDNDFRIVESMSESFHKTLIWSAKEAIFKKYSQREHLIFKKQIAVESIDEAGQLLNVKIEFSEGSVRNEKLSYCSIDDFILVYSN